MKAKAVYTLSYREPERCSRWVRHAFSAAITIATMGEPVPPGGGQILIADSLIGQVRDTVDVSFGDDGFTRAKMEEDLRARTAEEFAAKWISKQP